MARKYYEVTIRPAAAGFGEYDRTNCDEMWSDLTDLLQEIEINVEAMHILTGRELVGGIVGTDDVPDTEDITGRIHNCPPIVFAYTSDGGCPCYAGIDWTDSED